MGPGRRVLGAEGPGEFDGHQGAVVLALAEVEAEVVTGLALHGQGWHGRRGQEGRADLFAS
jgi:hypothetical protein